MGRSGRGIMSGASMQYQHLSPFIGRSLYKIAMAGYEAPKAAVKVISGGIHGNRWVCRCKRIHKSGVDKCLLCESERPT